MAYPAGMIDLPVEIILEICTLIAPRCADTPGNDRVCVGCYAGRSDCRQWHRGQADLSRLSRTCKSLSTMIQPMVFQSFRADFGAGSSNNNTNTDTDISTDTNTNIINNSRPTNNSNSNPLCRAVQLTRSLIARPGLARCLRSLSFSLRPDPELLTPSDKKFVEDTVVSLGLSALPHFWNSAETDEEMQDSLRWRYTPVPLELALIHASAVEYLEFPSGQQWKLKILPALASRQGQDQTSAIHNIAPSFPHLHSINITHLKPAYDSIHNIIFSTIPIDLIQHTPNLRALGLPANPGYLVPHDGTPAQPGIKAIPQRLIHLPHLRRIHFHNTSFVRPQALQRLLAATPQLEALALQWDPPREVLSDDPVAVDKITLKLWTALAEVRHTLRELRFEVGRDWIRPLFEPRGENDNQQEDLVHGQPSQVYRGRESLADFERLEHVSLDTTVVDALWEVWMLRRIHWRWEDEVKGMFFLEMFAPTVRTITFWGMAYDQWNFGMAIEEFARQVGNGGWYPNLERVLIAPHQVGDRELYFYGDWASSHWPEPLVEAVKREFAKAGVEFCITQEVIDWQYDDIYVI